MTSADEVVLRAALALRSSCDAMLAALHHADLSRDQGDGETEKEKPLGRAEFGAGAKRAG